MSKKETTHSYEKAQQELEKILRDLQEENVGIDELGGKIARAKELIQFCRERLRQTEVELEKMV